MNSKGKHNEKKEEVLSAHGGQDKFFYFEIGGKMNKKKADIIESMCLLRKVL